MKHSFAQYIYCIIAVFIMILVIIRYTVTGKKFKTVQDKNDQNKKKCNEGVRIKLENNNTLLSDNKMVQFMMKDDILAKKIILRSTTGGGFVHLPIKNTNGEEETTAYVCKMDNEGHFNLVY